MKYLRWLLFPFSLVYGLVVIIRNWCYDSGAFKNYKFTKPVISVGNLDVGGAGKSPMAEYLIRLLKDNSKLATLSRGYGRKTKGYLVAGSESQESRDKNQESRIESQESRDKNQELIIPLVPYVPNGTLATQIGDEPAQFKHKFSDITVAVCENRVEGIQKLLPDHDLVLMDDAYQHRAVEPGLSILLFDYNRINEPHLLLPAGNLREPFSGRWRAQVIIVTKCPPKLTESEMTEVARKVDPLPYQALYFTSIAYQPMEDLQGKLTEVMIDKDTTVFLLTGIANAAPLVKYLSGQTSHIIHHNYPDHHPFTIKNITKLVAEFSACESQKKIIITTEKDAQRLEESWFKAIPPFPVFVLPIRVEFLNGSGLQFDQFVTEYVREHTTNH
jgi:tetraacyldisaccharide 4'-kinase